MSRPLRYLSLFSGLEAAHLAWHPLGWECVAVAVIRWIGGRIQAAHDAQFGGVAVERAAEVA